MKWSSPLLGLLGPFVFSLSGGGVLPELGPGLTFPLAPTVASAASSAAGLIHGVWRPVAYLPIGRDLAVQVRAEDLGEGAFELYGWIRLNDADRESVWEVLTDFGRMHEIVPAIAASKVVAITDTSAVVDHEGLATFILRKTLHLRMEYRPKPPWAVHFAQIEGDLGSFSGSWAVAPIPGDSLLLSFRAVLDAEIGIPSFALRPVMAGEIRRLLPAVAAEIDRRRARRLFEVLRAGTLGGG